MGKVSVLFLMLRAALLNFFQGNARNGGNFFVGQLGLFKHGVDHFELSFCTALFLAFMKFVFKGHILACKLPHGEAYTPPIVGLQKLPLSMGSRVSFSVCLHFFFLNFYESLLACIQKKCNFSKKYLPKIL